MAIPKISDLKTYIGTLIDNTYWNFNFTKLVNWFSDGTADLSVNSITVSADSSFGNAKITNLGTPTASTDAASKGYVDNTAIPSGYLWGYKITDNGTTPHTDLDISAGVCQSATNTKAIITTSTLTKRASTAWSAGTGNGMLDTGTFAASTTYYVFAIAKADGTSDILCSLSSSNPLLPTGYTVYRLIGIFTTDGSTYITTIVFTSSVGSLAKYDYANPISKVVSTSYTAECNGILYASGYNVNQITSVTISGITYMIHISSSQGSVAGGFIPIAKGQVYTFNGAAFGAGSTVYYYFIPQIAQ